MSKLKERWENVKAKWGSFKDKYIIPMWHSFEASLIKIGFRFKKTLRIAAICIFWLMTCMVFIVVFAWLFKKTKSLETIKKDPITGNMVMVNSLAYTDYVFFSASTYFTGSYYDKVPSDKTGRLLFIFECFVSVLINSLFIGYLTYHFLKPEKTISLSKYIYITEKEKKIILRTRIADFLNNYVNHNYVIEFYYWKNNEFRTTYLTLKCDIAEMAYVFNTWTVLKEIDKDREKNGKNEKMIDYFSYLFNKMKEAGQKKRYFICVILSGAGKKNGDPVVIKKYYKLNDIKFCEDCRHVFEWQDEHPFVSKRIWGNLHRYTPMNEEKVKKIKDDFTNKSQPISVSYEWNLSDNRMIIS